MARTQSGLPQGHGDRAAVIIERLGALVKIYPEHIRKEDQVFFPNAERYLSPDEQAAMVREFFEFDRAMIHEKYRAVVEQLAHAAEVDTFGPQGQRFGADGTDWGTVWPERPAGRSREG